MAPAGNLKRVFTGKSGQNRKKILGELCMRQKLFKTAKPFRPYTVHVDTLRDENYVELIYAQYSEWLNEFREVEDKRLLWDLVKYRIRQITIAYSKEKAKERRRKLEFIENKLKECKRLCAAKPTESNIENFQKYKFEYDSLFDYIAQGNIVRSRATWYEKRERNNKYFLNLENKRNAKNCIRKLFNKKNQLVKNSKDIMTELKSFYQDLFRME